MKRVVAILFSLIFLSKANSQVNHADSIAKLLPYWHLLADKQKLVGADREEFFEGLKALYYKSKQVEDFHLSKEDYVWLPAENNNQKNNGNIGTNALSCTNIDFESGTTAGWTQTNGFNPLFSAVGCCTLTNQIDQAIMTGGVDPLGGFPRVFPGGGNFSLRLGSTAVGGRADRIEQTFFVTPANANFTYRYAVVLNDGGHALASQPRFTIEMLDSLGNQVPCTFYNVSAGSNIAGFQTSTVTGNVIFKPWTNVAIDLTPNIGQNVTLRFTAFDCGPSGHYAYAYIDGTCTNFATSISDTACPNIPITMCGPVGFSAYTWNGPGVTNATTQCISTAAAGVYTCQTLLVAGCPGPTFTHTLVLRPNPVPAFSAITNTCSLLANFSGTATIPIGAVASYSYNFADGTGTPLLNPSHTFTAPGSYQVKFKAISTFGCRDSSIETVNIFPPPTLTFSPPSHCINTVVNFTNSSNVPSYPGLPAGSVVSYTWNLGNGQTSNLINPSTTYTSAGVFTITLSATSDHGCIVTKTQTLGIFPPPAIDFSANPLCDINGTAFTPITTSSISSGSVTAFFWDFGDSQTSTLQNPNHVYNAPGVYTISYMGVSNHNCSVTVVKVLTISPTPTIAFTTTSINACTPNFTFANTSSVSAGSISYTWNFGGTNSTTAVSPSYTFPGVGSYTVRLIGTTPLGCADTALAFINVFPFPVVTLSVPASCESAIFTVSTTAVTGSVSSYSWNFGDPASGASNTSSLQSPTHQYPSIGNYTIALTVVSNLNCALTFSQAILVHPNPVTSFTTYPSDACNTNFSFINNSGFAVGSPPGNIVSTSSWNFNGLGTSTLVTPTYTFPGPGFYTVSLTSTSNFNCKTSQTISINIYPYPQASISVAPVCMNVAAAYAPSVAASPVVTTYTWNFGDGSLDVNLVPTPHFYLSSGSFPVSFSVTSINGCVTTTTSTAVVYPVPTMSFNAINPCVGAPITFSNACSIPSGFFITNYRWDYESDGITNSTLPNPTHTYVTAGSYSVQLFAISNNSCRDSIVKIVSVNDIPKPAIASTDVCNGLPTIFSGSNSVPGTGAQLTAYSWNLGTGIPLQTLPSGSVTYNAPGVYTIQLTATNNFNCSSTTRSFVTVFQMPVADFGSAASCLKSANIFTNTSFIASPDQIVQYQWDFGGGMVNGLNKDTSFVFNSPGMHLVSLKAISNNQCTAVKTISVLVHDLPTASFSNSLVCVGDKIKFINLSSSSDGSIAINAWDFDGDNVTNQFAVTPDFVYTALGKYPVTLRVTSVYGCTASVTKTINANARVAGGFTADKRSGCPELCINFSNLSSISQGNFSSNWDFGDGSSPTGFKDPSHCFGTGDYDITLTLVSDSGCKTVVKNNSFITVFPRPVANFQVTPDEIDEDDPTITVNDGSSKDATFIKYYVSDGSSFGTPEFTHVIKNLEKKIKPVVVQLVKNQYGCSDTLLRVLNIKPAFALYVPNVFTPNADGRNDGFQAKGVGIEKYAMQIYDRWGHKVWETDSFTDSWDGSVKGVENAGKQDVYTWRAQVTDIMQKQHTLVGHVTLLR